MFDVVWYVPERVLDVDKVLARLTLDEANDRDVPGDVVMSQPGVPIPGQSEVGRCVVRNFLGASDALPLGNTSYMESICDIVQVAPGLVGGTLKPEFLLSDEMEQAESIASQREAMIRASRPWSFGRCVKYTWLSILSAIAGALLCARAIPSIFKRKHRRSIRRICELEGEFQRALGGICTRTERRSGGG